MIQQLREENKQLHQTIRDVRHKIKMDETASSQSPLPLPRTKSPCEASVTQTKLRPIPAPRSNKSIADCSGLAAKETDNPEARYESPKFVDDEQVSASAISDDLCRMSLKSSPEGKPAPFHSSSPSHPARSPECYTNYAPHQQRLPYRSPSPVLSFREQPDYSTRPYHPPRDFIPDSRIPPTRESIYRGPTPSISDFTADEPRQFARLKISLENLLPRDATEQFKYQILIEHLKFEEALLIAHSYSNYRYPYTYTMQSLSKHYGQPHQLALGRIEEMMDGPNIRSGDTQAFRRFAIRVRALVGMLDQLGDKGSIELQCGSHVARLMSKLPRDLRANFKRYVHPLRNPIPNLLDFSHWLEFELQVQPTDSRISIGEMKGRGALQKEVQRPRRHPLQAAAILHSAE